MSHFLNNSLEAFYEKVVILKGEHIKVSEPVLSKKRGFRSVSHTDLGGGLSRRPPSLSYRGTQIF